MLSPARRGHERKNESQNFNSGAFWCLLVRFGALNLPSGPRKFQNRSSLVVFGCVPDKTNMNQGTVAQRLAAPKSNFTAVNFEMVTGFLAPRLQRLHPQLFATARLARSYREGKAATVKFGKVSALTKFNLGHFR